MTERRAMTERLHGDDPRFGQLFAEIRTSWFRLETLQHYEAVDESAGFEAFRFGGAVPRDPADDAWATLVRGHVSAGRALRRVHVIVEPPEQRAVEQALGRENEFCCSHLQHFPGISPRRVQPGVETTGPFCRIHLPWAEPPSSRE
jgi:hypothetical protein